jgi:hypothetical protein
MIIIKFKDPERRYKPIITGMRTVKPIAEADYLITPPAKLKGHWLSVDLRKPGKAVDEMVSEAFPHLRKKALELFPYYAKNGLFPKEKQSPNILYDLRVEGKDELQRAEIECDTETTPSRLFLQSFENHAKDPNFAKRRKPGDDLSFVRLTLGIRDPHDRVVYDRFSVELGLNKFKGVTWMGNGENLGAQDSKMKVIFTNKFLQADFHHHLHV